MTSLDRSRNIGFTLLLYPVIFISMFQHANMLLTLPTRLSSIVQMIPPGSVVADIGADHGLLSLFLSQQCKYVIATDASALAIRGVRNLVQKCNISDRVTIYQGDGLYPLIENKHDVDAIVLSGMGIRTIQDILSGLQHDKDNLATANIATVLPVIPLLSTMNVNQVILQPWPPNIIPYLELIKWMNHYGWRITRQTIDQTGKAHFITSSFGKGKLNQPCLDPDSISIASLFEDMPLAKDNHCNHISTSAWKSYIKQQHAHVASRLNGRKSAIETRGDVETDNKLEINELRKLSETLHRQVNIE
jgi:hypothetical protein